MGKRPPIDRWSDPPSEVRITVLQDAGDRSLFRRLPVRRPKPRLRRPFGALGAVVVVAAVGAILATMSSSSPVGPSHSPAHEGGATGVAAAYGYPTRCLSVTISAIDPAFAREVAPRIRG